MKMLTVYTHKAMHMLACMIMLALMLALAAPAMAQDSPGYNIEINKGKLIRLSTPASAVIAADPNVADVQVISPTLVYVNGKAVGETTIFAVDNKDNEILHAVVTVTHNLSKLENAVKSLVPGARVKFRSLDGALVIDGNVDSPIEAENVRRLAAPFVPQNQTLINMVQSSGSDQVTLMVKIAEVQRTQLKRFGIHLENLFSVGNFVFGLAQGRDVIDGATGLLSRNGTDNTIYTGLQTGSANVNGVIDALEGQGLITVLAEPSLTAMSGQPASFLAGGEFPVPSVGEDGAVSIEYQPFGVSLAFTPTILSKEKISLTVTPEVSELSQVGAVTSAGFNIPSLVTRRANTTVELGSGQSFAIAGLLQNNRSNDINKFPALGDLPVLGALFRSSEFRNDQTELVIIITPYIVKGVNEQEALKDPVQGIEMASDVERILFGKLYHENGEKTATRDTMDEAILKSNMPRLHGPAGYMMK